MQECVNLKLTEVFPLSKPFQLKVVVDGTDFLLDFIIMQLLSSSTLHATLLLLHQRLEFFVCLFLY